MGSVSFPPSSLFSLSFLLFPFPAFPPPPRITNLWVGKFLEIFWNHNRSPAVQISSPLGLPAPALKTSGDLEVELWEDKVWGGEQPQLVVMPKSLPIEAAVLSRGLTSFRWKAAVIDLQLLPGGWKPLLLWRKWPLPKTCSLQTPPQSFQDFPSLELATLWSSPNECALKVKIGLERTLPSPSAFLLAATQPGILFA